VIISKAEWFISSETPTSKEFHMYFIDNFQELLVVRDKVGSPQVSLG